MERGGDACCCPHCDEVADVEVAEKVALPWLRLLLAVCEVDEAGGLLREEVCDARPDVRVGALLPNHQLR